MSLLKFAQMLETSTCEHNIILYLALLTHIMADLVFCTTSDLLRLFDNLLLLIFFAFGDLYTWGSFREVLVQSRDNYVYMYGSVYIRL